MIRFGPSGNSAEFYDEGHKHTYEAMKWVAERGLNAYEYSFGRGVRIGEPTAKKIADEGFGPDFAQLAPLLVKHELYPRILCESKDTMAMDAVAMKKMYEEALNEQGR